MKKAVAESRTGNSIRNVSAAFAGHLADVFCSFAARMVFVRVLPAEYLGMNGLFTNILGVLSLLELGLGAAVLLSLYGPMAQGDREEIKRIAAFCGRGYKLMGAAMALGGLLIYPFVRTLVEASAATERFGSYYLIYLFSSVIYYWYGHRRMVLIAGQRNRIILARQYFWGCLRSILQIAVLLLAHSYLLYLALLFIANWLENIAIDRAVRKLYPWLFEPVLGKLSKDCRAQIRKNTGAMFCHRIGNIFVNATDSILIAGMEGMAAAGCYSNYLLATSMLQAMLGQVYDAVLGSVGNLDQMKDIGQEKEVFDRIYLIGFWMAGWLGVCLLYLLTPFITICFGASYRMDVPVAVMVSLQFYLTAMRKPVLLFRDAMGLFYYDRWKPFAEAAANMVISIILGRRFGVAGIAAGTVAATLLTCFWVEPVVLYRKGFRQKAAPYFCVYAGRTICFLGMIFLTGIPVLMLPQGGILPFLLRALCCVLIPNLLFLLVYGRTKEMKYWLALLRHMLRRWTKAAAQGE